MPKLDQRGVIAQLFILLLLGAGLAVGIYLLTSGSLKLFSKASVSGPVAPETSFTLVGPDVCASGWACFILGKPQPQEEFEVKLYARSDIEAANLFTAKMTFPKDLVEVKEIKTEGSFIKNWVEEYYDNDTGVIDLAGGVPSPGFQTQTGGESALMATITFKAKALGKGSVAFTNSSAIYSNLNNIDILTIKRNYDFSVEVAPSPSPVTAFGNAIKFSNEGTNNAYVAINPNSSFTPNIVLGNTANPPFTFEVWINTPKPPSGNSVRSYSIATFTKLQSIGDYGYIAKLSLDTQEQDGASRPMFSVLTNNGGGLNTHLSYTQVGGQNIQQLKPNTWYHIAGTLNSEGDNCVAKLFINGILVDTEQRFSKGGCIIRMPNAQDILLAKPEAGAGGVAGYYYPGMIDELRISNNLRYTGNFTPSNAPFKGDQNTIALYHFDKNLNDFAYYRQGKSFGDVQFVDSAAGKYEPIPTPTPTPSSTPKPVSKGDGNKDGKINLIDMSVLHTDYKIDESVEKQIRVGIDMNGDGMVNVLDFTLLRNLLIELKVVRVK